MLVGSCCVPPPHTPPPLRGKFENNTMLYDKFVLKFNDKLTTELNLTFCGGHHG